MVTAGLWSSRAAAWRIGIENDINADLMRMVAEK